MPWLPSHQDLREHPKLRKVAVMLGVPRAQAIGHLHCLWWWALSYADDGDLSHYDATDIALAAEWEGDPEAFLTALADCGAGGKHGFIERTSDTLALHDWDEYGGKYVERRRRDADRKRAGSKDTDTPSDGPPQDIHRSDDGNPTARVRRKKEEKEEKEESSHSASPKARTAVLLPPSWTPTDAHQALALEQNVNVEREAEQFRDFHRAKGSKFKDWDASFRTWLRNAPGFGAPPLRVVGDPFTPPKERYT